MVQVVLRGRGQLVHHLGAVVADGALLGCGLLAARPSAHVGVGLKYRVDGLLRQPEQRPVGLPEQRVVVGIGPSAGELGGERHAVATFVDRVHGAAHRHFVEHVQPHALMHQHTVIMRVPSHAGVTPCYSEENS